MFKLLENQRGEYKVTQLLGRLANEISYNAASSNSRFKAAWFLSLN